MTGKFQNKIQTVDKTLEMASFGLDIPGKIHHLSSIMPTLAFPILIFLDENSNKLSLKTLT